MSKYYVLVDGQEIGIQIQHTESGNVVLLSDEPDVPLSIDFAALNSDVSSGAGTYSLIANGRSYQVHVEPTEEGLRMVMGGHRRTIEVLSEREWRLHKIAPRQTGKGGQATVKAPMPGLVKAVNVAEGDDVAR